MLAGWSGICPREFLSEGLSCSVCVCDCVSSPQEALYWHSCGKTTSIDLCVLTPPHPLLWLECEMAVQQYYT